MKNIYLVTAVVAILVGAGGFFAGMKYQQGRGFSMEAMNDMRAGGMGNRMAGQRSVAGVQHTDNSGMIVGEVIDKDETSFTVKLADESTKIVLLSESTTISKSEDAMTEDLETGARLMVFGEENSDGSVTAQNIQVGLRFGTDPRD